MAEPASKLTELRELAANYEEAEIVGEMWVVAECRKAFQEACSPERVLELLAALEQAEANAAEWEERCDHSECQDSYRQLGARVEELTEALELAEAELGSLITPVSPGLEEAYRGVCAALAGSRSDATESEE